MYLHVTHLSIFAVGIVKCAGFTVTTSSPNEFANAIISGPGLSVVDVPNKIAPEQSIGTFTDGPFGIGNGGIISTGYATRALESEYRSRDNGGAGSETFCGGTGYHNAVGIVTQLQLDTGYNGLTVEFIFATA
ncbi:hypothetical protein ACHAPO_002997 [Fusarium lateritium]